MRLLCSHSPWSIGQATLFVADRPAPWDDSIMAPFGEDGRLAELENRLTTERNRLAEMRQRVEQAASRAKTLQERSIRDRLKAADQADLVVDTAESFATYLEARAVGDAGERRLKVAQREREIAAVERRNAAKLRQAGAGPLHLERLPAIHHTADES